MKTRIICLFLLLSLLEVAKANPVSEKQAREIGAKFLSGTMKTPTVNADALRLVKTYRCATGEEAFFVFNFDTGFVIVAADDYVTPVLGYSYEGPFDTDNIPVQLQDYLNGFLKQIEYGVSNHLEADEAVAAQWQCVQATGRTHADRPNRAIYPLLNEKWNQGDLYNRYCPADSTGPGGHVWTGCVATAMAQIMHYWRYPEHGQGSHSYTPYTHPEYGEQSVDFSAATYRWDQMPYSLSSESSEEEIDAVATLMYHCGVSVDMMYAPGGSGAFSQYVPSALENYFNYSEDLQFISRQQDDAEWLASIKACLDLYRPVYYAGHGSEGGHAFICDGYDQDDLLHFNWGWGGAGNGFFALNDIEYGDSNCAIVNIHPPFDPNRTCQITLSPNSSTVGTVSGDGVYQYGSICTVMAEAVEGCKFRAWLENGKVVSVEPEYEFLVMEDRDLEAFFDGEWTAQVEAARVENTETFMQETRISWANGSPVSGSISDEWPLLASYANYIGVATDGIFIYGSKNYYNYPNSTLYKFCKLNYLGYVMESFEIEGCGKIYDFTYDGQYFYGSLNDSLLYGIDLVNKTLVDVIHTPYASFRCCAYDPDHDGFWVSSSSSILKLINRDGQVIKEGPYVSLGGGAAYYKNSQGEPHLLYLKYSEGVVCDYDINAEITEQCQVFDGCTGTIGAFIGTYLGKIAFFVSSNTGINIYELPLNLSQVQSHRIYRVEGSVDEQEPLSNPELIADRFFGSFYTDLAFDTLPSGTYTYGVSLLTDGMESEIHWSNPVEHINHYAISANVNIEEGGTVAGQGVFWEGETCTLTATANPGYGFVDWRKNGEVVSVDSVLSFTVTEDAEYMATFEYVIVEINAYANPSTAGSVTGGGSYHKGEMVTLTVVPEPDYHFGKWTENDVLVSNEATISFVATVDRTLIAELLFNYAVDEQDGKPFALYPSPTNDRLLVECPEPVRRCEIFSITGALVYSREAINEESLVIPVDGLPSGLYLIRLAMDGYSLSGKFVKQ